MKLPNTGEPKNRQDERLDGGGQQSQTKGILFDLDQAMGGHQSMQYPSAQFQSERFLNYLNNIRDKRK